MAYIAVPSSRNVRRASSGCLSLCGENAVGAASCAPTCHSSASWFRRLPVVSNTNAESSLATAHASSYASSHVGFQPCCIRRIAARANTR